jgi:hypothetical protein
MAVALRGSSSISAISPKNSVGCKLGDGPVADLNPDLPAFDDEKIERIVAFPEDDVTRLEGYRLDGISGQYAKARVVLHWAGTSERTVTW